MEIRNLNIIFSKNGQGRVSTKINLPLPWLREMGINENSKTVTLKFDDNKIIISPTEMNEPEH